jgi:hypothetical protein
MDIYIKAESGGSSVAANWDYIRTWQDDPIVEASTNTQVGGQSTTTATTEPTSAVNGSDLTSGTQTGTNDSSVTPTSGSLFDTLASSLKSFVNNLVEFFGNVIFHGNVQFVGTPTFNQDTAGFTVIKNGNKEVEIKFEQAYANTPVITATMVDSIQTNAPGYYVTGITKTGFRIVLDQAATADQRFSWIAIAVDGVNNNQTQVTNTSAPTTVVPTETTIPTPETP